MEGRHWDPKHLIHFTSAPARNISRPWPTTMTTSICSTRSISLEQRRHRRRRTSSAAGRSRARRRSALSLTSHATARGAGIKTRQLRPERSVAGCPRRLMTKGRRQGTLVGGTRPQDLYAQYHRWAVRLDRRAAIPRGQGVCEKYFNRTIDLIDQYHSDPCISTTRSAIYPSSDIASDRPPISTTPISSGRQTEAVMTGKV